MKKLTVILISIVCSFYPIFAEPLSLNTEISSVYMSPKGFGFGLAPTGTNFVFYDSFQMIPQLTHKASFKARLIFRNGDNIGFGGYNYTTGTPEWIYKYTDIKDENLPFFREITDEEHSENSRSYRYFKPEASANLYLSQGFGINPVEKSGPLLYLGIGFTSRYSRILESLNTNKGTQIPTFFNPVTNTYIEPFGIGSHITAYPWLQDNRQTLANSIYLNGSLHFSRGRGFGASDGVSLSASFEFGPKWLANDITMEYPTSDYFSFNTSLSQSLTLFVERQNNGLNWLSIQLSHSNSYSYTGGNIIPEHAMTTDRLNQSFSDYLSLTFNGPQFIAWDCYTDLSLVLSNSWYFGHILNEPSKSTFASEWISSLGVNFHMRLFGFMHFSYGLSYPISSGIHMSHPAFSHSTKINFYISL